MCGQWKHFSAGLNRALKSVWVPCAPIFALLILLKIPDRARSRTEDKETQTKRRKPGLWNGLCGYWCWTVTLGMLTWSLWGSKPYIVTHEPIHINPIVHNLFMQLYCHIYICKIIFYNENKSWSVQIPKSHWKKYINSAAYVARSGIYTELQSI